MNHRLNVKSIRNDVAPEGDTISTQGDAGLGVLPGVGVRLPMPYGDVYVAFDFVAAA